MASEAVLPDDAEGVRKRGTGEPESSHKDATQDLKAAPVDAAVAQSIGQGTDQSPGMLQKLLAPLPPRWQNWFVRGIMSIIMILIFTVIIYLGPLAMVFLILLIQLACFYEIINIGYVVYKSQDLPWFRTLSWFFLFTSNYFFFGESMIDQFRILLQRDQFLQPLLTYHRFISFSLYCGGIVGFVMSLVKQHYLQQFTLFGWTHMALLVLVTSSHFMIRNVFNGVIWLLLPSSMIICNDIMAYMFGFFFGKTPLIKLSPKKTWEGFIGGGLSTIVFSVILGHVLIQFDYFVCPLEYDDISDAVSMECVRHWIFDRTAFQIPIVGKLRFDLLSEKSTPDFTRLKMLESTKRAAIYVALCAGQTPTTIVNVLGLNKDLVYRIKKDFDNFEGSEDDREAFIVNRKRREGGRTARSDEFVETVKQAIKDNPDVSMRALGLEHNVSEATIRRIVHDDLGLKSYKLRKAQILTEKQQEGRYCKSIALLNSLKHGTAGMLRFFSDEKNFNQHQKINSQNDRYLTDDPAEVPIVMQVKFPVHIMVLGVVSSEVDVMPPHFFEKGLKVNADEYIKVLRDVVKPWMDQVANGREYVFQQDSAPAHSAKKTQAWLEEQVPNHWPPALWPANSPDLNPLDYYVWGVLERKTNRRLHSTVDSIRQAVVEEFANMDKGEVAKACRVFRSRIEAVVAAKGGYIEN